MAIIKNTAAKAFIIPFMPELTGLVAPGECIENVPAEALECDFIKGCVERGEMVVLDASCEEPKRKPGRPPRSDAE